MKSKTELMAAVIAGDAQEVFAHTDTGHYDITAMRELVVELDKQVTMTSFTKDIFDGLTASRDVCPERVEYFYRQCREAKPNEPVLLGEPGIWVNMQDDYHLQIDGTHRLLALWRLYEEDQIPMDHRFFPFYEFDLDEVVRPDLSNRVDLSWGTFTIEDGKQVPISTDRKTEADYLALFSGLTYPEKVRGIFEHLFPKILDSHERYESVKRVERLTNMTPKRVDTNLCEAVKCGVPVDTAVKLIKTTL